MKTVALAVVISLAAALCRAQDLSAGPAEFDAAVPAEVAAKRVTTGHLLVKPVINGHQGGWFIFDTGAAVGVLSTPHLAKFGASAAGEAEAEGSGGSAGATMHRVGTTVLGPLTLHDQPMIAVDLSFLTQYLGEEIEGVLGYGVFAAGVVEMDLATPRIALYEPAGYTLAAGEWTSVSVDERVPIITAKFEGREGRFMLDTGANESITFYTPAVKRLALLDGRTVTDAKVGGVGGLGPAKRGPLATFEVGGQKMENVSAAFVLEGKGTLASASREGQIGAGLLQPFLLVIDYPNQRVSLRPRAADEAAR